MGIIIIILHHPPSRTSRTSNKCIRIPKNMSFKKKKTEPFRLPIRTLLDPEAKRPLRSGVPALGLVMRFHF
jgi:hypothetical protein